MPFKSIRISVLVFVVILTACSEENKTPIETFIPVRVLKLQSHESTHGSRYSAAIIPKTQLNLAFKVNGYIESIKQSTTTGTNNLLIDRGDLISKGDILARIKDDQYQDKVKQAKASLAAANAAWVKARADYQRASILYKEKSMTAPDYDSAVQEYGSAKANVADAKAQLDDARQNLAYCALTTPMSGVILQKNIEIGSLIKPGMVAFVVADMTTVKVVFAVPDTMLKNIILGTQLKVKTRAVENQIFTGTVTNISPSANQQTRVFEIEISIDNSVGLLKDGMVAALQIPESNAQKNQLFFLPISTIVRSKEQLDGYAVYTVRKKGEQLYAELRNVRLGDVDGNNIQVLSGLNPDDQIIVSGVNTAWDGALIRVID